MQFKALTSLLALVGLAISLVTGVVKWVMPAGRIAYWTGWSL